MKIELFLWGFCFGTFWTNFHRRNKKRVKNKNIILFLVFFYSGKKRGRWDEKFIRSEPSATVGFLFYRQIPVKTWQDGLFPCLTSLFSVFARIHPESCNNKKRCVAYICRIDFFFLGRFWSEQWRTTTTTAVQELLKCVRYVFSLFLEKFVPHPFFSGGRRSLLLTCWRTFLLDVCFGLTRMIILVPGTWYLVPGTRLYDVPGDGTTNDVCMYIRITYVGSRKSYEHSSSIHFIQHSFACLLRMYQAQHTAASQCTAAAARSSSSSILSVYVLRSHIVVSRQVSRTGPRTKVPGTNYQVYFVLYDVRYVVPVFLARVV